MSVSVTSIVCQCHIKSLSVLHQSFVSVTSIDQTGAWDLKPLNFCDDELTSEQSGVSGGRLAPESSRDLDNLR